MRLRHQWVFAALGVVLFALPATAQSHRITIVKDIDYGNFKNSVSQRQGRKRHDAYAGVWDVLADKLPEDD